MPGIDGLEAVQRIKTVQPDVPVVFFTSFDDVCMRDCTISLRNRLCREA